MPPDPQRLRGLREWIACGFGSGHAPVAPGTFGSLVALPLAWAAWSLGGPWAVVAAAAAATAVGWWTAETPARRLGVSDPGCVVIDEIAGQLVALAFVPPEPAAYAASFLLFRLFDITKPPPARRLEKLHGASGIMADDLVAGLYANLLLQLLRRWIDF